MDNGASSYRRFRDQGDENGLAEIIRQYRDGLIYYIFSIVGDIHAAEELCEDVFVLLGTKKPKDKGIGSFKTWLYTIGRNRALNYLKRHKQGTDISLDELSEFSDERYAPERTVLIEEQRVSLHDAMNRLKPEYRQILWLYYFEGFSLKEAAAILHKSVRSTEVLISRARQSLRSQLEMEDFHYEKL